MIQCLAQHVYLNAKDECNQEFSDYSALMEHIYRDHRAVLVALVIASTELYEVIP